jgi:hypothetical protein
VSDYPFKALHLPPPGWLVMDKQLAVDGSVAGYLARGRDVIGRCYQQDCRRRCDLPLEKLVSRRLGSLRVSDLKPLLRCSRLGGCSLDITESGGREVTLGSLVGRPYVGVRIACSHCQKATIAKPETVIARLTKEGLGGGEMPVDTLAAVIRRPCSGCKHRSWVVSVLWHPRDQIPEWFSRALR